MMKKEKFTFTDEEIIEVILALRERIEKYEEKSWHLDADLKGAYQVMIAAHNKIAFCKWGTKLIKGEKGRD